MPKAAGTKPRLDSLDDLFGLGDTTYQELAKTEAEYAVVPFDLMDSFPGHPFRLYIGQRKDDMVESIREKGILQPLILRAVEGGRYQILSGHNRKECGIEADLTAATAVIKYDLTDAEAWIYVIETNIIQRSFSDLTHSEKAAILAVHHSKLFSQGRRNDIVDELKRLENPCEYRSHGTCAGIAHKLKSRDVIAKEYSLTKDKVAQYLRIGKLISVLKERLDIDELGLTAAVTLSFLNEVDQAMLDKCIGLNGFRVDMRKADTLRQYSEKGKLDEETTYLILSGEIGQKPKPNRTPTVKVSKVAYAKYFRPSQSAKEIQGIVEKALEAYFSQEAAFMNRGEGASNGQECKAAPDDQGGKSYRHTGTRDRR